MRSPEHLAVSVPVTTLALAFVRKRCSRFRLAVLGVYGVGLGAAIDLDHLLLGRVYAGDWRHTRTVLADPIGAITDQDDLFDDVRDFALERLLTHVLIGGGLVWFTRRVSRAWGFLTAIVLYVHLVCDLLRDNRIV